MFGRKKEEPPPKRGGGGKALMAQLGMADIDDMVYGDLDNDEDLEAELRALQAEDDDESPVHTAGGRGGGGRGAYNSQPDKGKLGGAENMHKMIAQSMRDIPSDEEVSDTEDPDLLAELDDITGDSTEYEPPIKVSGNGGSGVKINSMTTVSMVSTIQERLHNYRSAFESAQATGDSGKTRRAERGIKTLEDLMKQSKAGKQISEDDIPPAIAIAAADATKTAVADKTPILQPPLAQPRQPAPVIPAAQPIRVAPLAPPKRSAPGPDLSMMIESQPNIRTTIPSKPTQGNNISNIGSPQIDLTSPEMEKLKMLTERKEQYKMAALKAKRDGDDTTAVNYIRVAKQFDNVIDALKSGNPVDLSKMPPPPGGGKVSTATQQQQQPTSVTVVRDKMQGGSTDVSPENEELPETSLEEKKKLYKAPESAGSILDALNQRLAKYKEAEEQAKQEDNPSKVKRQGRIVKQYVDAIKLYKTGKPVDFEELPCPPGFPPIPVDNKGSKSSVAPAAAGAVGLAANSKAAPVVPANSSPAVAGNVPKVSPKPNLQKQVSVVRSRAEQQAAFLEQRQAEFKQAAIQAKNSGDIELAKKYLRMAKGFDQMIEASKSGLPVDLTQVPAPPGAGDESSFEFVNSQDAASSEESSSSSGDRNEIYKRLQDELVHQVKTCESNRDHFTKLGDVSSATKFDKMCQSSRKDLDSLKNAYDHSDPVPRFHYETRQFSLVQCCTDLGDNDLELVVVRGLNYNLPSGYAVSDLHTYVKFEFPFPDTPQTGDSAVIKGSNCPEYNQSFKLEVNRKSRSFLRLLKSNKFLKFDVYYKKGFLKGDKILGTVNVKLQPLEDKCIYHESFDLMEGRKAVGGKLEVKIRVRDPFVNKQVEEVKEKWLIIDELIGRKQAPAVMPSSQKSTEPHAKPRTTEPPSKVQSSSSSHSNLASISVLRYEKQQLDQRIAKYQTKLTPAEMESLRHKGQLLEKQADELGEKLKKGGMAFQVYIDNMKRLQQSYVMEAKTLAQEGNKDKLQIVLTKKKLVDKEIESIQSRLSPS